MKTTKNTRPDFVLDCSSQRSQLPYYNSLNDVNLRSYFSTRRKIKHLIKAGIIKKVILNPNSIGNAQLRTQMENEREEKDISSNQGYRRYRNASNENSVRRQITPRSKSVQNKTQRRAKQKVEPIDSEVYSKILEDFRNKIQSNQPLKENDQLWNSYNQQYNSQQNNQHQVQQKQQKSSQKSRNYQNDQMDYDKKQDKYEIQDKKKIKQGNSKEFQKIEEKEGEEERKNIS